MEREKEQPGPDIVMELEIELDEAFRGTSRIIELNRDDYCAPCRGEGWPALACKTCRGRGEVISIRRIWPAVVACPACASQGAPAPGPCSSCGGRGRTSQLVRLEIHVPPGVETGMILRLRNQGALGNLGAPRGNLCIRLLVKEHPMFKRRHNDLYSRKAISSAAMAAGSNVRVPTLDGECDLKIPKGTISGDTLRIKRAGMRDIGGIVRGDLFVEIVRDESGSELVS
jgi:molecular chaperone DnaJ